MNTVMRREKRAQKMSTLRLPISYNISIEKYLFFSNLLSIMHERKAVKIILHLHISRPGDES